MRRGLKAVGAGRGRTARGGSTAFPDEEGRERERRHGGQGCRLRSTAFPDEEGTERPRKPNCSVIAGIARRRSPMRRGLKGRTSGHSSYSSDCSSTAFPDEEGTERTTGRPTTW